MDIKTGITFPKPIRRKERHDSHLTAGVPIPTLADEKKFEKRKTKKKNTRFSMRIQKTYY